MADSYPRVLEKRPVISEMSDGGRKNLGLKQKQREQGTETYRFHVKTKKGLSYRQQKTTLLWFGCKMSLTGTCV